MRRVLEIQKTLDNARKGMQLRKILAFCEIINVDRSESFVVKPPLTIKSKKCAS